jgi:hypothetical protein
VLAEPELQVDRPPGEQLVVGRARAIEESRDRLRVEPALLVLRPVRDQRVAVALGDDPGGPRLGAKAELVLAGSDVLRKDAPHRLTQDALGLNALDLHLRTDLEGKLDDPVIQVRNACLNRVGHGVAVLETKQ